MNNKCMTYSKGVEIIIATPGRFNDLVNRYDKKFAGKRTFYLNE